MLTVQILLALALAGLLLPAGMVFCQVVMSLRQPLPGPVLAGRPPVAVIIPAHDEAAGIVRTLQHVLPQLAPGDSLIVVADNCTDGTAALARRAGAEVVERHDALRRGKGYALDCGVRALAGRPAEVVVILDADCIAEAGCVDGLARAVRATGRPVQALDLMRSPPAGKRGTRIAEFAWLLKNQIRPAGYLRLGLPCQLMGTGMAFPRPLIDAASLANGHLVEDMKLGLELAASGCAPLFFPAARVVSYFPTNKEGIAAQRARWERGHLGMIRQAVPAAVVAALRKRNWALLALALDMLVPPLALLCLLILSANIAVCFLAADSYVLALCAMLDSLFAAAVAIAWLAYGRAVVSLGDLCYAAVYVLLKMPMYLRFLIRKKLGWVRAARD